MKIKRKMAVSWVQRTLGAASGCGSRLLVDNFSLRLLTRNVYHSNSALCYFNKHNEALRCVDDKCSKAFCVSRFAIFGGVALPSCNRFAGMHFSSKNRLGDRLTFDSDFEDDAREEEYQELYNRFMRTAEMGHQLLVIQPYIKWGPSKKLITTPELQLEEAVALVRTLRRWTVVDTEIISLKNFDKKTFFGKGNLERLQQRIRKDKKVTGVFISTNILKGIQHKELEDHFGVPVFDRYTVVIQIFREHARTKEAKLQVAMAEVPYLWSRLRGIHETAASRPQGASASVGGPGETYLELRRRILSGRERKLQRALESLRSQRQLLRSNRQKHGIPVVAVVGYTNAGKTSLIKALTGDDRLEARDELFATLDVTVHAGFLPCRLQVLYVDTVGFISDIPTQLLESFRATLEDAMLADVVVHVRDVSHPDSEAQAVNVDQTLKSFDLSPELLENVIVVGNKIDLLPAEVASAHQSDWLPVSATRSIGLDALREKIEGAVLRATGRTSMAVRVPSGGEESRWLYKEAAVVGVSVDPQDEQYVYVKVVISDKQLGQFKRRFLRGRS
ncbi:putative GTP-binding protein 6 [Schistocerca americana]|uniref:putative GTP-binding protein 6 n=1 Tax=Schistocerca americana TaxID=7009 RepID=UPI001F4F4F0A|nr:putative GTP-binding protein 6 [Schistocerca americana]